MLEIGVLDTEGSAAALLARLCPPERLRVRMATPGQELRCDLLMVAAGAAPGGKVDAACRILLTPPGRESLFSRLELGWVVSWGASGRDSVSFSSLEDGGMLLSIRRVLPTLTGGALEVQDIPLRFPPGLRPETALPVWAALLLCGERPPGINGTSPE